MSLHEDMDRLSLTDETDRPESQQTQSHTDLEEGGAGNSGEEAAHILSPHHEEQSSHTPDPSPLRKFVSSSSLFEGDQHLFEFIDEPVSRSWPSPPSDLDRFDRMGSRMQDDEGEEGAPATGKDDKEGDDGNHSASYNFLDDESGDRSLGSEKLTGDCCEKGDGKDSYPECRVDGGKEGSGSPPAASPSTCRSTKGRAPPPPTTMTTTGAPDSCPGDCHMRNMSFMDGSGNWQFSIPVPHRTHYHICPEFRTYNYMAYPGSKVRFYQVGYNTNLKKPTENWVRMKSRYHAKGGESARRTHTSHSYSHYYGYEHNWLSYAFAPRPQVQTMKKYSVPSSWKSRKQFLSHFPVKGQAGMHNFDNSLCMCCVCCNCAKTNQTNCCCCYHCVHTVSSCRRSDVLRMIPFPAEPSTTPGAIVSILKKKGSSSGNGIKIHDAAVIRELDQSHEQEYDVDGKPECITPDSGMRLLSRDEEEGQESKAESALLATAPSPTLSGPTPITEPTELELDETKGCFLQLASA